MRDALAGIVAGFVAGLVFGLTYIAVTGGF